MGAALSTRELSSTEFARLLSVYFRGLFFKPPAFETEGLHPPSAGTGIPPEKELFIPYLKEKGILDLRKMASGKPFDSLFPPEARTKDIDEGLWPDVEKSIRSSGKTGGFIRVFIEKRDASFITRMKASLSDLAGDGNFSVPEDFFICLADSGVYLCVRREEKDNVRNLCWDFARLEPPLAHALKPHKRDISVYDAYEWYGEKAYGSLAIGAEKFPDEKRPCLLIQKGGEYCVEEVIKAYQDYIEQRYHKKAHPTGRLLLAIYEMLETPHNSKKTVEEIKRMVFGSMKRRKNDDGPLSPQDIQNIKNAAEDISAHLNEDGRGDLEAAMREGILEAARELQRLFLNPSIKMLIDVKRIATIEEIFHKVEGELSLDAFPADGEGSDLHEILEDKKYPRPETEFLKNWRSGIMTEFLEHDFKILCMESLAAEFEGEEDFIGYLREKTWKETAELLLPYTSHSSNTGSVLYREYCRIRSIPGPYLDEGGKLHTRFAKKIRGVFNYIRKEAGDEVKGAWDE
ncbi:hypothetical protein FACS189450_04440 [Spirochaetia bacterium]|nr:hypothetical protein FACS189450_04440 [Spirochaetia bacterium]